MSPLDKPLRATVFASATAPAGKAIKITLRDLARMIEETEAPKKSGLPLVKLARFKDHSRSNANLRAVSGIELDYDAGEVPMADAVKAFRKAGVAALLCETPSSTRSAPRWRAFLPLSNEVAPDERAALVARANGVVGGIVAGESFTPSQAYFIGCLSGKRVKVELVAGDAIDARADLGAGIDKRQTKAGDKAKDESRSGRHYAEALQSVRSGLSYEDHLQRLDADLSDYAAEPRGRSTKGERDWERAEGKVQSERDAITDKLDSFDNGDSNSFDESDFLTAEELAALERPFDFLEGLLFEQQLSMVYGPPKAGKSFLIMDMACAVGLGRTWAGRQCDPRKVLVIPLEGRGTIIDRVRAWEMENDAKCPLIFRPKPLDLINGAKDVKAIIRYVKKHGVGLVIIDTLSRAIAGAEENSATDMSKAVRVADMICRAGAHTMLVHHAGKSGTMRGSNALIGAPDLVIKLNREGEQRTAIIEENRHGKDGEVLRFTLEPRRTDIIDARRKAVHSAVVKLEGEWFEDHETKDAAQGDEAKVALHELRKLARIPRTYPNGVPAADWRTALDDAGLWPEVDNASTRRSCFKRTKDRLVKAGLVVETKDGFKPKEQKRTL